MFNIYFFPRKSCSLWDNVEKKMVQPDRLQMAKYNTVCAICMLVNWGYRHTLRICNAYCWSTQTIFARNLLKVMFTLHCVSCRLQPHHTSFNILSQWQMCHGNVQNSDTDWWYIYCLHFGKRIPISTNSIGLPNVHWNCWRVLLSIMCILISIRIFV